MRILVIDSKDGSSPNVRIINFFKNFRIKFSHSILILSFPDAKIKGSKINNDLINVIKFPLINFSSNRIKNFFFKYIIYVKIINKIIQAYKPDIIFISDFPNIYLTYIFFLKAISRLKCKLIAEWYDKNTLSNYDKIFNRKSFLSNLASTINEYFGMFSYDYILYSSENFKSIFKSFKLKKINGIKVIPPIDSTLFRPYPKKISREIVNNTLGKRIFSEMNQYILFYMGGNFDYYFQLKSIILLRKYLDKNINIVIKSPENNPQIEKLKAYFPDNLILIDKYIDKKIMPYFISSFDLAIYVSNKRILNENFRYPYRMLECLACGLPIVMIGNVGELARTIINYKCGIVLDKEDYKEAAKIISEILKDKERLDLFSYNARKFAEEVSMESTTKLLNSFFNIIAKKSF
jgi:glycosyltransferase involved in cell wall biosynthesis